MEEKRQNMHWIFSYSLHSIIPMSFQNKLATCKLTIYHWVLSNGQVSYYFTSTNTFVRGKQNPSGLLSTELLNKAKEKVICDLLFDDAFRKLSAAISSPICSLTAPFYPKPEVLLRLIFGLKCLLVCSTIKKLTFPSLRRAQDWGGQSVFSPLPMKHSQIYLEIS